MTTQHDRPNPDYFSRLSRRRSMLWLVFSFVSGIFIGSLITVLVLSWTGSTTPQTSPSEPMTSVDLGRQIAEAYCASCHMPVLGLDSIAPDWRGLYGKIELLDDGTRVIVDDEYLRESITHPTANTVEGHVHGMMSFAKPLTAGEVEALVEYIKSLR